MKILIRAAFAALSLAVAIAPPAHADTHTDWSSQHADMEGVRSEREELQREARERGDRSVLEQAKNDLGAAGFAGQHQQCPSPAEGGVQEQVLNELTHTWDDVNNGVTRDFVNAIVHAAPPRTTLEQALVVAKITDGIYASAARGGRSIEIA